MRNVKGPMGRAAYDFGMEEFKELLGIPEPVVRASVSWMANHISVHVKPAGHYNYTLHDFKHDLGITDTRGEVVEVYVGLGLVRIVMSDRELS